MIKQEHIQRTERVRMHSLHEKLFAAELRTPRRRWSSQLVQRKYSGSAKVKLLLSATCCCAGPVRDRHGRRFTTFPCVGTI
ncbi:hypothetical protein KUH03_01690 [Sphingobacterium sp. E70]|uniref:hypothetical protein n=1 Tax=Sphingobacterium sp. E70 TaxID=2853439 RepID=UPI00211C8E4D|nr:hypothetical protein [Sphingobacterium sp. E70]ULT25736.1 hypothetical protein KUH03_01690 [Sphingobacterium sp. E70]